MENDESEKYFLGSFYTYLFIALTFIGIVCSVYITQL